MKTFLIEYGTVTPAAMLGNQGYNVEPIYRPAPLLTMQAIDEQEVRLAFNKIQTMDPCVRLPVVEYQGENSKRPRYCIFKIAEVKMSRAGG